MTDNRTTTSTTWGRWQIISTRCYGCAHSEFMFGKLVCSCVSRTIRHDMYGDTCESYFGGIHDDR